jgi:purine catabolism regulator
MYVAVLIAPSFRQEGNQVHLTVEQALSIYPLSEGHLVAGKSGTSRIVKSVNVMDAPDIGDWIKNGEMLFTTAYLMKDSLEDAIHLLHKLDRRGSSGLGIKMGRFWSSVPEPLIEEANHLGFPLIELPYRFTLSDQMNGLFHAEMQRSTKALHSVLEKQKQLMRFALQSEPIHQLFEAITGVIGYPMAIIGSRGHFIYNGTLFSEKELMSGWPWKLHHQWVSRETMHYYRIPFMEKGECAGFVLFFPPDAFVLKIEEGLFHQAVEIINYHIHLSFKEHFEHSLQQDFGSVLIRYFKNSASITSVVDYAERLNPDLFQGAYQCILADVLYTGGCSGKAVMLERLKEEQVSNPIIKNLKGIHVYLEEGLFSIYPTDSIRGEEKLAGVMSRCMGGLYGKEEDDVPQLAISSIKAKPESLLEAFDECLETLQLAKRLDIEQRVIPFETVEWAYLFQDVPQERMRKYCDKVMGGLFEKEDEYAAEMLRTLEAFLENDGQVNETAKRLFIHRNTATYRIEKISELLKVDFKKTNDLLKLKLVFLFRRVLLQE